MNEAWLAGRAGRDDMLLHGTTVNPAYYRGASYAPGTPAAGCLVADETWSPSDGRLLTSNQLRLLQTFVGSGSDSGYLIVAEIDAANRPVTLADISSALIAAEARLAKQP